MSKKIYPCDGPEHQCPFGDSSSGMFCRNNCGLGAEEAVVDEAERPDEEYYNSQEIRQDKDDPTPILGIPLLWR
jgi:hypothetical protein